MYGRYKGRGHTGRPDYGAASPGLQDCGAGLCNSVRYLVSGAHNGCTGRAALYAVPWRTGGRGVVELAMANLMEQQKAALANSSLRHEPDSRGHFGGRYGGRFVAETLMPLILELEAAYAQAKADPAFQRELDYYLKDYVGRPSPLWLARRMTEKLGGAKIYLKREELNHTGSHKLNNVMGQILLARRMGRTRIVAETGAGQHGVATATVCALFGLKCVVYMGATDVERQKPNVFRMRLLGAEVVPVTAGAGTLKDAMNEAMRDWVANVADTYMLIGTVAGPSPYPAMVRDFQSVIGTEVKAQMHEAEGRLPDVVVAAIGGGSNAMGIFHPFLDDTTVRLIGVEAAGHGLDSGKTAASIERGRPGVLHGNRTYLLQNTDGQIEEAHSISAGLDYPGVGLNTHG